MRLKMKLRVYVVVCAMMMMHCIPVLRSAKEKEKDFVYTPSRIIPVPTTHLNGIIMEKGTLRPIPSANIYFGKSDYSVHSDSTGRFKLAGLPVGTYQIVIILEGLKPIFKGIRVYQDWQKELRIFIADEERIALAPIETKDERIVRLEDEIRILRRKLAERADEIALFETFIVGHPENCTFINRHLLDFEFAKNPYGYRVEYTTREPLEIENQELGYRLTVFLKKATLNHYHTLYAIDYDASIYFEELTPLTEKMMRRWEKNRYNVYDGSLRHFLASLVTNELERNKFDVCEKGGRSYAVSSLTDFGARYFTPLPMENPYSLIHATDTPSEYELKIESGVDVIHHRSMGVRSVYFNAASSEKRRSSLTLPSGSIRVDRYGRQLDFNSIRVSGYWAATPLSDLLPDTYFPKE